jgi:hypothetical protein
MRIAAFKLCIPVNFAGIGEFYGTVKVKLLDFITNYMMKKKFLSGALGKPSKNSKQCKGVQIGQFLVKWLKVSEKNFFQCGSIRHHFFCLTPNFH